MTKILIIDDEPELLDIVCEYIDMLEIQDITLLKAGSFEEAEKLVESSDAILSDINIPNKEKLDLLLTNHQNKPIARITGNVDNEENLLMLKKPFTPSKLKEVIENLVLLSKKETA